MSEVFDADLFATAAYRILNDYFEITLYRPGEKGVTFRADPRLHERGWKRALSRRLAQMRARAEITREGSQYIISVRPLSHALSMPPLLNILLFIATFLSVLLAAAYREVGPAFRHDLTLLATGLPFTLTLLGILLVHEMGHFIAGYRRGVVMSYPYFIPFPPFLELLAIGTFSLGTFGAVIKGRTPIRNRNDLIMIGASGPIAGAIPAMFALIWGFMHSIVGTAPVGPAEGFIMGDSLVTWVVQWLTFGSLPDSAVIQLSPVGFAGYVGLLVTMLNLLPLGQLDGGHIIYGLVEKHQRRLAFLFLLCLLPLGFLWKGWWLWMVIAMIMRPFHPPVIDGAIPPDRRHRWIGWVAVVLFIITFVPCPIR